LYLQLEEILGNIPYRCAVDEFQHHIYRNPEESPDERAAAWHKLELEYLPFRDFGGDEYLVGGRLWQRQAHIYQMPFYYIDYNLAQVCAIQFFLRFKRGDTAAWSDYLKLCRLGGTETFVSLIEHAGLRSPFIPGVLSDVAAELNALLNEIDDSAL
jgi:oligoendopeptidase F